MKHADCLIEIHTEELPPKSLLTLAQAFRQQTEDRLKKAELSFDEITYFATPRRIALLIKNLEAAQADQDVERKGPAVAAAFDKDGKPTQACIGFAKSCGVEPDKLMRIKNHQGEWVGYQQHMKGKTVDELLPTIIEQALAALPIAKRMRWGASDVEFVRTVHSVILLYGDRIIEAEILGCKTGHITRGHRFHAAKEISIKNAGDYESVLEKKGHVIADFAKRREMVRELAFACVHKEVDKESGLALSDELLDEVTALVEYPVALCGKFDAEFLKVPTEVLISAMEDHQRYFPVLDKDGKLQPYFVTISNIESKDPAQVIHGNERVLRARLSDAAFFYHEDLKQRLDERIGRLKGIVYQAKLGTLYDKVERISKLAGHIAGKIGGNRQDAERAGMLAKADLTTAMVCEFPELQGIMGCYYAEKDGEKAEVASAIKNHYMPRYAGEPLMPESDLTIISLALADRIDTLVGAFGINQVPTGDKDPYGLRRAAIGVLRYLIECKVDVNLQDLIEFAIKQYQIKFANAEVEQQVLAFIIERLRAWYQEQGISPDIFAAVAALNLTNLLDIDKRIKAVQAFKLLKEAEALSVANKRVSNILKTAEVTNGEIKESLFEQEEEKILAQQLKLKEQALKESMRYGDYQASLLALADLRQPVDNFFDHVMVMTEDKSLRDNRVRLLSQLRNLFLQVADIALLQ